MVKTAYLSDMAKKKPEIDVETLSFSIPGVAYDALRQLGTSMGLNENSTAKLMLLNSLFVRISQDSAAEAGARKAAKEIAQGPTGEAHAEVQVPVPPPEQPSGIDTIVNATRALQLAQGLKSVVPEVQSGPVALYDAGDAPGAAQPGERYLVVREGQGPDDDLQAWCGDDEIEARAVYEAWVLAASAGG